LFLSNYEAMLVYDSNLELQEKSKDNMAKKVGELTIERDFVVGKLKSLVSSSTRNNFVDTKLDISLNKQLKLLSVSKGLHYYKPIVPFSSTSDIRLLSIIDLIYTKHPYYGVIRVKKLLNRNKGNYNTPTFQYHLKYIYIPNVKI